MKTVAILVALGCAQLAPTRVHAQDNPLVDTQTPLALAARQLEDGELVSAERTLRRFLLQPSAERAEAFRLLGLSLFYQERALEARAAFLDYLLLRPDAHLDPALVPPEAISVFEDVRARNFSEIESRRPKPKKKRYMLLNLVPGAGQLQNGDSAKAVVIGLGLGAAITANVASYYWLTKNCDKQTRVCGEPDEPSSKATDIQVLNQLSGATAIGIYVYAVIDGYLGYRSAERAEKTPTRDHMRVGVLPNSGGTAVQFSWTY